MNYEDDNLWNEIPNTRPDDSMQISKSYHEPSPVQMSRIVWEINYEDDNLWNDIPMGMIIYYSIRTCNSHAVTMSQHEQLQSLTS